MNAHNPKFEKFLITASVGLPFMVLILLFVPFKALTKWNNRTK